MIKIIHTADIHLGSKINANLSGEKMQRRRLEVRETFMRLADFAEENGVKVIMLSGDVFDEDRPFKKDKDFFYSVIKNHPNIDFLYLRGNHDKGSEYTFTGELSNLKTFSENWTYYEYDNVVIGGVELNDSNKKSLYTTLNFNENKLNIAMLHGQVSSSEGKDNILISKLKDKNINYLALGHIHEHGERPLDSKGVYAYSGCLEGRGYDETGEKGFVLLTVDGKITSEFIPFSKRQVTLVEADVSNITNSYDAYLLVKRIAGDNTENLLRVILKGEVSIDNYSLESDLEKMLEREYFAVSVKDKTTSKINIEKYQKDLSLKGEFVRVVYADNTLSNEEKSKIIRVGLKALMGEKPND